ncbi:hypothetical protein [Pontibacter mangrovi]|uniref:STAS/SEC14 domain-containing protein n=1 Tax=Pontibacter mangrovi TaxID=2589816 RepID=A0A501W6H3_9BACT|nr:hypothetical protein [Pontibacter mangrovi]TPE44332.1 hypothetical protein FJM65_09275 [Pontibacter mangrovi]
MEKDQSCSSSSAAINRNKECGQQAVEQECLKLYHSGFAEITLDKRQGLLVVRWLRPVKSQEYREGIEETGRILLERKLEKLLVNNQRMGVLTMDDQGWLAKISVEVISKSNLKYLAIVSSVDVLQQLTNEVLDKKVKKETPLFDTQYFLTEGAALEWLTNS